MYVPFAVQMMKTGGDVLEKREDFVETQAA
jgi:hypothetical protein